MPAPNPFQSGARFSRCRRHRTVLWRRWADGPSVNWIMLNPSTADERINDPTIERCQRRSRMLGFGAMTVTNLFSLRATRPEALYRSERPASTTNARALLAEARRADCVIAAWGVHGALNDAGARLEARLARAGIEPLALGITAAGHPRHPLYVSYAIRPGPLAALRSRT